MEGTGSGGLDAGGSGRMQDEEAEVQAAAAVGDIPPERGPAAYLAEFLGTFVLVLAVTLAVSEFGRAPLSAQELAQGASPPFIDFSVIGLVHVFVLFMLIQTLAIVSGAHFNPAVTAALAAIRQIRGIDAAIYVVLQLAGGVLGALVTKLILKPGNFPNAKAVNYGAVGISDALGGSTGLAMLVEGIGTFLLVFAIVGVAVNPNAFREWAGLVIGGTLGFAVMLGAGLTGAGFNPARAFGPALASGHWGGAGTWLLVYVLAPLIGALIAAFAYMQMFVMQGKKGPFGMSPVG
ncbi:MAG: glycerol uptake facilitator protein [Thermoleophilaceae bacterium]|nr:glycerol uptake facilitator protein [Thermoleophilaceae bacterium]